MGYADTLFDLTDRVVLITGGSRGLGREMAFAVARCGADVIVASRKFEACVATAEEIAQETGRTAMPYQVHVGRWDQLDGLVEAAYDRFGKVDTLINNAGMSPTYDSLTSVSETLFDAVVNLNLKGPFRLSTLLGERMVAAGGGSIINVSSIEGLRGAPWAHGYVASKWGVRGLAKSAALELAPHNIRVNSIHPGLIRTPMTANIPDDMVTIPLGRPADPIEVSTFVLFLASDEASYATGTEFVMDGGLVTGVPHKSP